MNLLEVKLLLKINNKNKKNQKQKRGDSIVYFRVFSPQMNHIEIVSYLSLSS